MWKLLFEFIMYLKNSNQKVLNTELVNDTFYDQTSGKFCISNFSPMMKNSII